MITAVPSYRPRNPGHDYYGQGVYLVTIVIGGRTPLLGRLGNDPMHPEVHLSPLGEKVLQEWEAIPAKQLSHGNKVAVHACVCMPDHFHGVIEALEPMQWSLGDIIQAFKATCTSYWQAQQGDSDTWHLAWRTIDEERMPGKRLPADTPAERAHRSILETRE